MGELTVRGEELARALKRLKRFAGRSAGVAVWTLGGRRLEILWGGLAESIAGSGEVLAVVRLQRRDMDALAKVPPTGEELRLRVADGRLHLGDGYSVPCEVPAAPVTPPRAILPINPSPLDVLLAAYRHPPAEIAAAGAAEPVADAERRRERSIDEAAAALAWLNLPRAALATLVEDHLRDLAR